MERTFLRLPIIFTLAMLAHQGAAQICPNPPQQSTCPPVTSCPGTAIASDADAIYIVQGNRVVKISKGTQQILADVQLRSQLANVTLPCAITPGTFPPFYAQSQILHPVCVPRIETLCARPQIQAIINCMSQLCGEQFEVTYIKNAVCQNQGAIELSQCAVQRSQHSDLRSFARKMIDNASCDNVSLVKWSKQWYGIKPDLRACEVDCQTLNQFRCLSSTEFDIQYMRSMIIHLKEDIQMNCLAQRNAAHSQLSALAARRVNEQSKQIQQLRTWLSFWYNVNVC